MTRHRTSRKRPQSTGRRKKALRVRAALRTPPDLQVLAEALIDLAYDAADRATEAEVVSNAADGEINPLTPPI